MEADIQLSGSEKPNQSTSSQPLGSPALLQWPNTVVVTPHACKLFCRMSWQCMGNLLLFAATKGSTYGCSYRRKYKGLFTPWHLTWLHHHQGTWHTPDGMYSNFQQMLWCLHLKVRQMPLASCFAMIKVCNGYKERGVSQVWK